MRLIARSSVLVLVSQLIIYCPPVLAQGAPGGDTPPPVTSSEKSPATAALLEAFTVPTLGYAHAGSWARGLPSAAVQLLGVGLALEQQFCLCIFEEPPPCVGRCIVGIALADGASRRLVYGQEKQCSEPRHGFWAADGADAGTGRSGPGRTNPDSLVMF